MIFTLILHVTTIHGSSSRPIENNTININIALTKSASSSKEILSSMTNKDIIIKHIDMIKRILWSMQSNNGETPNMMRRFALEIPLFKYLTKFEKRLIKIETYLLVI